MTPPPHMTGIHAPARLQPLLEAREAARANGETLVLSTVTVADGRVAMWIEIPAAAEADEASRLEIAAAGLQTKATAVRAAVAPVLEVEAPK
jgi:hypothetical protein